MILSAIRNIFNYLNDTIFFYSYKYISTHKSKNKRTLSLQIISFLEGAILIFITYIAFLNIRKTQSQMICSYIAVSIALLIYNEYFYFNSRKMRAILHKYINIRSSITKRVVFLLYFLMTFFIFLLFSGMI